MKDLEDELMKRAADGDEEALSRALELVAPRIRRRLSVPSPYNALVSVDDILQEAYTDTFQHIRALEPASWRSFESWFLTVALNHRRDVIRMLNAVKRGADHRRVESNSSETFDGWVGTHSTPSRVAAHAERVDAARSAVEKLPEPHRTVVWMYDIEQRPVDEVARALDRSSGAVYMIRNRALLKLVDVLGPASKYMTLSR